MSPDLLPAVPWPGSSAILVGGPGDVPGFDARRFGSILWLVDAVGALLPLAVRPDAVTHTVILDDLGAVETLTALERFQRRDPFHVPQLFVSPSLASRSDGRSAGVLAQVFSWCERQHYDQRLVQRVGFARQKNFLLNVTEYARRRLPAAWAGALQGVPAFVCGAGPSLDASVAALAAVADRGVVFAADSALRALARHGVTADIAISMSARKPPEQCLAPGMEPARVILSTLSPARWREAMAPDRRYFLARSHPTEDWLADQGMTVAPVSAAENCGITVLDLARFLGCAPIYLFGLDFAADANSSAHHSVDADPMIERNETPAALPRVPGNYATDVPTFLHADWLACDARLATWPEGLVHNVNDRGARLHQTRLVHPRQFVLMDHGHGTSLGKRRALAHLAAPAVGDADAAHRALAALGAQGARGCRAMADLRAMLAQRGPAALVGELRRLLGERNFARALGSFAQKMGPHLATARAGDAFWRETLDDLEELCCLAEAVYDVALV